MQGPRYVLDFLNVTTQEIYLQLILRLFILLLTVLPPNGPHITGEKKQYEIGDELNLNCSSGRSYPASILKWYINETPVRKKIIICTCSLSLN